MGMMRVLLMAICLFVIAHGKALSCGDGYTPAGPDMDWCCKGPCPRNAPWRSADDLCALSPASYMTDRTGWPPVCTNVEIATGASYEIFQWGKNDVGQCGIPLDSNHVNIHRPTRIKSLSGSSILNVALGYQHTIAITYSYSVYSWGKNDRMQLGLGGEYDQNTPALIQELQGLRVRKIAAGGFHSAAIDKYGNLYTWGSNSHGQLGSSDKRPDYPIPVESFRQREIIDVSLGLLHSCAISVYFDVYCWGGGFAHQLGLGTTRDEPEPRVVTELQGIPMKDIACGCEHTMALAINGSVWVWGNNKYGELGLGDTVPRSKPVWLEHLDASGIRYIAAGCHHSAAISQEGGVYMWGWNEMGQLGTNDHENRLIPTWVDRDPWGHDNVLELALGYGHTIVMTSKRKVHVWGYGDFGQLGLGDDANRTTVMHLDVLDTAVMKVAAGGYHSAAVLSEIVKWGPTYDPVDDPDSNQLAMNVKIMNDEEAAVKARIGGSYKETIRVHVKPGIEVGDPNELEKWKTIVHYPVPDKSNLPDWAQKAKEEPKEGQTNVQLSTTPRDESLDPDFIDSKLGTDVQQELCNPTMSPDECFRVQEEQDFMHPENEYEAKVKSWYEKGSSPAKKQKAEPSQQDSKRRRAFVNEELEGEKPDEDSSPDLNESFKDTEPQDVKDENRRSPSDPVGNSLQPSSPPIKQAQSKIQAKKITTRVVDDRTGRLPRGALTATTLGSSVSDDFEGDPTAVAGQKDASGEPVGVETQKTSTPVEKPPSPPVDIRNTIPMQKHVLPTRDQLMVEFSPDHRTWQQLKPYEHKRTRQNATAFANRATQQVVHHNTKRKTQIGIHPDARRHLHAGTLDRSVEYDSGQGLQEPQGVISVNTVEPSDRSTGPVADDDAPILGPAEDRAEIDRSGFPVVPELPDEDDSFW